MHYARMNSNAYLVLEDRSIWPGRQFGAEAPGVDTLDSSEGSFDGEVIFNTGHTGYHEILTDPSYTGQIVMMTYPHIGNYGNCDDWSEIGRETGRKISSGIKARGLVVRSVFDGPVPSGRESLDGFLKRHSVCGISDVDTRALTLKLRKTGSCNGVIVSTSGTEVLSESELEKIFPIPGYASVNAGACVGWRGWYS